MRCPAWQGIIPVAPPSKRWLSSLGATEPGAGCTVDDPCELANPAHGVGGVFPCHLGTWAMECVETEYVLQTVWMAYPDQAGSPQGPHGVNCDPLVANVLGIGSG